MKIVIDIPIEMIEAAKTDLWCGSPTVGDAIKHGTPYKERPQWIPCTERLPEECVNCLGWIDRECWVNGNDYPTRKQETAIGWHIDGRWHFDGYSSNTKCIAWMPLPEPYKKEGGADNEM
jgi:hypothetical protein